MPDSTLRTDKDVDENEDNDYYSFLEEEPLYQVYHRGVVVRDIVEQRREMNASMRNSNYPLIIWFVSTTFSQPLNEQIGTTINLHKYKYPVKIYIVIRNRPPFQLDCFYGWEQSFTRWSAHAMMSCMYSSTYRFMQIWYIFINQCGHCKQNFNSKQWIILENILIVTCKQHILLDYIQPWISVLVLHLICVGINHLLLISNTIDCYVLSVCVKLKVNVYFLFFVSASL